MLLEGIRCPACEREVKLSFTIADEEKTPWCFCSCGSVFHQKLIDKKIFNEEWLKKYSEWKALKERYEYTERVYLPLVEELTYGRRFLDVGFGLDHHITNLSKRGWVTQGIDLISNPYITADFETHDFKNEKYDFIHMGQVLESFTEPIKALYKAKELLRKDGLILITSPDAELIYSIGMWKFGNWNPNEKWIMFGETQIKKILDKLGFNIIISHKNTEQRFMAWNTWHILAQKKDE